jgi:hypothetical protein
LIVIWSDAKTGGTTWTVRSFVWGYIVWAEMMGLDPIEIVERREADSIERNLKNEEKRPGDSFEFKGRTAGGGELIVVGGAGDEIHRRTAGWRPMSPPCPPCLCDTLSNSYCLLGVLLSSRSYTGVPVKKGKRGA